jgi:hypothetical protein
MSDYIAMVEVLDESEKTSPLSEMLYLVDTEAYYLFCELQKSKPTRETLRIVLDWMVTNKKAIKLGHRPIQLWFSSKRDNMRADY